MISVAVPFHIAPKTDFFLSRLLTSLARQTFQDYEVVFASAGTMGENHRDAVANSRGEFIKLMQMDDYFAHEHALENIIEGFVANPERSWLISANLHDDGKGTGFPHIPSWNDELYLGRNTLGSVSTLTMRKDCTENFDPSLKWMIDVDLYWRLHQKYGLPVLGHTTDVVVQWHEGQQTNLISNADKVKEFELMNKRYGK